MKPLTKYIHLSALATLLLLPNLANADLFIPIINADSMGRAGTGTAFIGASAAVLENPAGLTAKNSQDSDGSIEISIGMTKAPELSRPNEQLDADKVFKPIELVTYAGGVHLASKRFGIGLSSGFFGGELLSQDKDSVYYNDQLKPIRTQYFGAGLGFNLLPNDWSSNLNLGISYINLPKAGGAIVSGVQSKIIDTSGHSFSLGASTRYFIHSDKKKLLELQQEHRSASIDLPNQTSFGASWLIKGWKNSFNLAVDIKETDYSKALYFKNISGISNNYSWAPELNNLGTYKSQHASVSWYTRGFGSWTLGYSVGNSDTANLDSTILGLSVSTTYIGLGLQQQSLKVNSRSESITSLILTLQSPKSNNKST